MDEEHKGLFQGIFDVEKSPNDQSKVDVLVKRVVDHFATEEVKIFIYIYRFILYINNR